MEIDNSPASSDVLWYKYPAPWKKRNRSPFRIPRLYLLYFFSPLETTVSTDSSYKLEYNQTAGRNIGDLAGFRCWPEGVKQELLLETEVMWVAR